MSLKKQSRIRLGTTSFLTFMVYFLMKFGCTPQAPNYMPERIWMRDLKRSSEMYCEHFIVFEHAYVTKSHYFFERCIFTIKDSTSNSMVKAISPIYRAEGTDLNDAIFYVEPIIGSKNHFVLLLREAKH